jgi:hypothetical protein
MNHLDLGVAHERTDPILIPNEDNIDAGLEGTGDDLIRSMVAPHGVQGNASQDLLLGGQDLAPAVATALGANAVRKVG